MQFSSLAVQFNVQGLIGGDPELSPMGKEYAKVYHIVYIYIYIYINSNTINITTIALHIVGEVSVLDCSSYIALIVLTCTHCSCTMQHICTR
jgi:hypothetical protein